MFIILILFLLVPLSAALLAHFAGRIRIVRKRRLVLIAIVAFINAALWATVSYLDQVANGMSGVKWGMGLQGFMEFDLFAIVSFVVLLFLAPECKKDTPST